jgi:hypothetical protein
MLYFRLAKESKDFLPDILDDRPVIQTKQATTDSDDKSREAKG